jgi:hypothetical protein
MKNSRFPALLFFSALLIGIGWTLVVIGILLLAFCAISLFISSATTGFGADLAAAMASGLASLALVLTGLFTVTGGESIRVFLAIEENTRAWTTVVARTE